MRRHDVDCLRVIALGLLIFYHAVVAFQPWAKDIFFIQNKQTLEGLWPFMSMLNVWRIPILFIVSGMSVCFAMEHRTWKSFLKDRALRILLPLIFGLFCICPISLSIAMAYYDMEIVYWPNSGHLWFLVNIFVYVLVLLPFMWHLKNRSHHFIFRFLSRLFQCPGGLYILALPMIVEAIVVQPQIFSFYAGTSHGFWLGLVCFLVGFISVSLKGVFWGAVEKIRHVALGLAFILYLIRLLVFELEGPSALTAFESVNWIFSILGYGAVYLNHPWQILSYLNKAVYPIYIVHMPVQFFFSHYLFSLSLHPSSKLLIMVISTFSFSLLLYELIIRRTKWIRLFFGMKLRT